MNISAKEKQKVLVVDDEKTNLKIVSDLLKDEVEILLAKDGYQAMRKAAQYQPDLILLDVVMPEISGFEVIQQLKMEPLTSNIPVIFITALTDSVNEEKGFELGACDYISKPFHAAIVKARVRLHLKLASQQALLEKLTKIDPLTSIANRRKYEEVLDTEWRMAQREQIPLSVAMIDIDNFKKYNDHYGHLKGDETLQQVASSIAQSLHRPRDLVARYGGEEFVAILPQTNGEQAQSTMDVCRQLIVSLNIEHLAAEDMQQLTVSIGGATCIPQTGDSIEQLVKKADEMLYQAKMKGRNKTYWQEL